MGDGHGSFKVIHIIDGELILQVYSKAFFRYNINLKTIRKIHKPRHKALAGMIISWCTSATKSFVSPKEILR